KTSLLPIRKSISVLLVLFTALFISQWSNAQTTQQFTGNGTFTPAAGVTGISVQAWGGGGGGGSIGSFNSQRGGGGGGGAFAIGIVTVVPGTSYNIGVGTG